MEKRIGGPIVIRQVEGGKRRIRKHILQNLFDICPHILLRRPAQRADFERVVSGDRTEEDA